jgi:hypothetical protein
MSLKSFLYALDATRIEEGLEFVRAGDERPQPTPADVKAQNAQSMQMLQGIMGGLGKRKR